MTLCHKSIVYPRNIKCGNKRAINWHVVYLFCPIFLCHDKYPHAPQIFPSLYEEKYVQTAIDLPIVRLYNYPFSLFTTWSLKTVVQNYGCSRAHGGNVSTSCRQVLGTHTTLLQRTDLQQQLRTYVCYDTSANC